MTMFAIVIFFVCSVILGWICCKMAEYARCKADEKIYDRECMDILGKSSKEIIERINTGMPKSITSATILFHRGEAIFVCKENGNWNARRIMNADELPKK